VLVEHGSLAALIRTALPPRAIVYPLKIPHGKEGGRRERERERERGKESAS